MSNGKERGFSTDWGWNHNEQETKFISKNQLKKRKAKNQTNIHKSRQIVLNHFNLNASTTNEILANEIGKITGWKIKPFKTSRKKIINKFASYIIQGKNFNRITKRVDNDFYRSREWRQLRYEVLIRCGRRCMCCGAEPKDGIILHVDHVKPRSKYPSLELDINNLQVLCEDCNLGKSNIYEHDFREI